MTGTKAVGAGGRGRGRGGPALLLLRGEGAGLLFALDDQATIGRAADNEVSVQMACLSRRHARVVRQGDDWIVVDLASSNGTRVNGRGISGPTALEDGDRIGLGDDCELLFISGDSRLGSLIAHIPADGVSPAPQVGSSVALVVAALVAIFVTGVVVFLLAGSG